jgi:hypothetical protein
MLRFVAVLKGPLSFVLFESPFTSVSTVSRGHPSLVSLISIVLVGLYYDWWPWFHFLCLTETGFWPRPHRADTLATTKLNLKYNLFRYKHSAASDKECKYHKQITNKSVRLLLREGQMPVNLTVWQRVGIRIELSHRQQWEECVRHTVSTSIADKLS